MVKLLTVLKPLLLHHQKNKLMNWGTKIIIGMLSFMLFIVTLGVLMFRSETDALVENDYYEKGLKYDEAFKQKENVLADQAGPVIHVSEKSIAITFRDRANGRITLMRSADKRMDRSLSFSTDTLNRVVLPLPAKGQWKLIIKWSSAAKAYLYEQEIIIP